MMNKTSSNLFTPDCCCHSQVQDDLGSWSFSGGGLSPYFCFCSWVFFILFVAQSFFHSSSFPWVLSLLLLPMVSSTPVVSHGFFHPCCWPWVLSLLLLPLCCLIHTGSQKLVHMLTILFWVNVNLLKEHQYNPTISYFPDEWSLQNQMCSSHTN